MYSNFRLIERQTIQYAMQKPTMDINRFEILNAGKKYQP